MKDSTNLARSAYHHIEVMASRIGPRPAGSEAEKRTFDYISDTLAALGYQLRRQPVAFAHPPRYNLLYPAAGLGLLISAWTLGIIPWLAFFYPLVMFALPQLARWQPQSRKPNGLSENLIADLQKESEKPALVLCAHVDSARANAIRHPMLLRLYGLSFFIATRIAVGLAAMGALVLAGLAIPAIVIYLCGLVGTLVAVYWIAFEIFSQTNGHRYSPGAYDNASGAGVLLALAETYAQKRFDNYRLVFLFTGAEETGMHGARTYANESRDNIWAAINLDMVGAGDTLRYVTTDGTIWPVRTCGWLNRLVRRANPDARGIWYGLRSADHLPLIQAGIPTASLMTSGSRLAAFNYHTGDDTFDLIEPACLEMVIQSTQSLLSMMDVKI